MPGHDRGLRQATTSDLLTTLTRTQAHPARHAPLRCPSAIPPRFGAIEGGRAPRGPQRPPRIGSNGLFRPEPILLQEPRVVLQAIQYLRGSFRRLGRPSSASASLVARGREVVGPPWLRSWQDATAQSLRPRLSSASPADLERSRQPHLRAHCRFPCAELEFAQIALAFPFQLPVPDTLKRAPSTARRAARALSGSPCWGGIEFSPRLTNPIASPFTISESDERY